MHAQPPGDGAVPKSSTPDEQRAKAARRKPASRRIDCSGPPGGQLTAELPAKRPGEPPRAADRAETESAPSTARPRR